MKKLLLFIALAFVLGVLPKVARAQVIQIDGSSTVFPITEAVAEEFQKAKKGKIRVTVGISGTGGGFKKFCRGETDIQDASRPILKQEMEACKGAGVEFIELPVAFDALTVIVNPKNSWSSSMTVAELKKIWEPGAQGKVTNWNQVREKWPNAPLKLFGAGADSGTFDYFTEAVVGKAKSSRGDFTASEDDNVLVQGVANDVNALGFFGFAYYAENTNKLKAVAIDNGKGAVSPSEKTVLDGSYQPLSRPIYIYVSKKSLAKPELKEFTEFYLKHAPKLVKEVKYVPLPDKVYAMGANRLRGGTVGTAFGGHADVGVTIDDLIKREPKL
jgi:phosphate transport system substrate-binding protein